MKKLLSVFKRKLPVYRRNVQLKRELSVWKKGLYPPGHYYSPIALIETDSKAAVVDYNLPLEGIDLKDDEQLRLLDLLKANYSASLFPFKKGPSSRYYFENDYFSFSDGIFLSLIIRRYAPSRIIEIGSGFSSAVMLDTNEKYLANKVQLTFIEPYPERLNTLLKDGEKCTLLSTFVQEVPLELFSTLVAGDILFVDSSHVSKYQSDVNYVLFEILPVLSPGVIIHFHDIFFPFEYPVEWIKQGRSWNEAYLLKAFLQYNSRYSILLFSSYMEGRYRSWFEKNMPLCLKNHELITIDGVQSIMSTTGQSIYIIKD